MTPLFDNPLLEFLCFGLFGHQTFSSFSSDGAMAKPFWAIAFIVVSIIATFMFAAGGDKKHPNLGGRLILLLIYLVLVGALSAIAWLIVVLILLLIVHLIDDDGRKPGSGGNGGKQGGDSILDHYRRARRQSFERLYELKHRTEDYLSPGELNALEHDIAELERRPDDYPAHDIEHVISRLRSKDGHPSHNSPVDRKERGVW